jgi:cytochrome c553
MKVMSLEPALQTAIVAILFAAASAADAGAATVSQQELHAKLEYCKTCHGVSGQGFRGASPMPRLAGQQTEYLENQLHAFIDRRRENRFMFAVAHVLSPEMITALATSFSDLNPKPLGGAPRELMATGEKIYREGVPGSDVPACASCHGPEAKGNGAFPRLAGQLNDYIFNKLVNWNRERGQDPANPDTSAIMQPIAHSLSETQIRAVAAYVGNLE